MFYFRCTGGGGYGDPLDREPDAVLADIVNGLLSVEQAYQVYGVVADGRNNRLDVEATRARRESILDERLRSVRHHETPGRIEGARTVCRRGEYLEVAEAEDRHFIRCSRCGSYLCPADQNPKAWAIQGEFPLRKAGPLFPTQDGTVCVLRQFYCPGCGVQFEVEVAEKGAKLLEDIRLEVEGIS
jgi:N-methylhydantoinase B